MRKYFMTAFVLAALLVFATSGLALEKSAVRATNSDRGDWNAGSTCSVQYYNICTGWLWIWSGWSSGDRLGVCYDSCCPSGAASTLNASDQYVWTAAPSGYDFTGTISVFNADANCCPDGAALATQTFLPVSGWNTYNWGIPVGSSFVVATTLGISALPNPIVFPTDHPAAGPTGPVACGTCFPTTRPTHSFYYGTAATPLCPGSGLNDGVCDAELWTHAFLSCDPISVEEATFGKIKGLYR